MPFFLQRGTYRQCFVKYLSVVEQENFSLGHSSTGLSRMTSQVVQGAGAHFPCKVVEDAVWEKTGRLGTNFS